MEQAVYNELLIDATLTRKKLSEKINCSEATIKRALATLVEKRIIKRSGANKNGFWLILRKMQ